MASLLPGFEYDIFISYRQKDNKGDKWVSEFVSNLKGELESTFKEDISIYFDENPHDGLLETHSVDKSLEQKLKCLIFIPVISQTYCDFKSFAWQHEFCAFNKLSKGDKFGRDIKLSSGNVSSRILPIKIHDLDPEDKTILENELGGMLRSIEFIYKEAGVNRPLKPNDDVKENLNKTNYINQVNKVANAVKEIITAIRKQNEKEMKISSEVFETKPEKINKYKTKIILSSVITLIIIVLSSLFLLKLVKCTEPVEKSIAVLPFTNLSNDPDQEYFSDGMVDAILDHLFKVGELNVISRTSTLRYKNTKLPLKEIAHELGVSSILEGTWQKVGNNVRITAQLIDTRTDTHLWSETYDRDISDIFSIYSEVAQNIARGLKVTLTSRETELIRNSASTKNMKAYDYYLRGTDFDTRYESLQAIEMYSKAIEEDPSFITAYSRRARTHLYIFWTRPEGWQIHELKALEDIKKANLLDARSPESKIAQAFYYYHAKRDYEKALQIVSELKEESPNMSDLYNLSSYILRRKGDMVKSISEAEAGIKLDPFNIRNFNEISITYKLIREYDEQIRCIKKGLALGSPGWENFRSLFLANIYKYGDLNSALKESGAPEEYVQDYLCYYSGQFEKAAELIRIDSISIEDKQFQFQPKTYRLAYTYFLDGNKTLCKIYADSAITLLKETISEFPNDERLYATLGKCYAFEGNVDDAIFNGKKAIELKPLKLDAWQGAVKEQDLMEIYIYTGNFDLALDKMEYLLSIPSDLQAGDIVVNPLYDPLRKLPRYKQIIETAQKTLKGK